MSAVARIGLGVDIVAERSLLGGLERWLGDPAISEVMVNADGTIWTERLGRLSCVGTMSRASLLAAVEQLLAPIGRRLDRSSPIVDARMADGSRLCAVVEPVSVGGPCLSVRRFAVAAMPLVAFARPSLSERVGGLVTARRNVLVSGATSSGKTTLLNALGARVPADERIVTLEDVAELRLDHPHVVRLETRPSTPDGVGEVSLAQLLRAALRLRPDRLLVGEVRGSEALALLHAMNTGHDGSLATIHANSAGDALTRLAALVVHEVPSWPLAAVNDYVGRSIHHVVHLARSGPDGERRIVDVVDVTCDEGRLEVTSWMW